MIVAFLRHGSTEWNEQGRMQGRRDVPLSAAGRKEVEAWRTGMSDASLISRSAQWYSSPLRRAVETAEILSGASPQHEPALIEMDWGDWEGRTLDELRVAHGAAFAQNEDRGLDFRPPNGESPRDVHERLRPWLRRVANGPGAVIAVTHLGVLRVILAAATGWDMTGKPPVRLNSDALHRFAIESTGRVTIDECNLPLAPAVARITP